MKHRGNIISTLIQWHSEPSGIFIMYYIDDKQ